MLVAWAATLVALIALSQPFFYYPDVDTHAELVDALDETPSLALDPRPYQAATGAWTRGIGGTGACPSRTLRPSTWSPGRSRKRWGRWPR